MVGSVVNPRSTTVLILGALYVGCMLYAVQRTGAGADLKSLGDDDNVIITARLELRILSPHISQYLQSNVITALRRGVHWQHATHQVDVDENSLCCV